MPLINRCGGGGDAKLNIFCQPDLPTDKFDGILLQTTVKETLKKVIFDENPYFFGHWETQNNLPLYPNNHMGSSIAVGDFIYFFGGYDGSTYYKTVIRYSRLTNTYTQLNDMPYAAGSIGLATDNNGHIFLFGGIVAERTTTSSAYRYNIADDTYAPLASIPYSAYNWICTFVPSQNAIKLMSGTQYESVNWSRVQAVENYSIVNNTFTQVGNMPSLSTNDTGREGAIGQTLCIDNIIYFVFNYLPDGSYKYILYSYNVTTSAFTKLLDLPYYGQLGVGPDNTIYLFKSKNSDGETSFTYNKTSNSLTAFDAAPFALNRLMLMEDAYYSLGIDAGSTGRFVFGCKQYDKSPAVILHVPGEVFKATIMNTKLSDIITWFKDAMLFKDGNLTFPALYVGNGTQWVKEREGQ